MFFDIPGEPCGKARPRVVRNGGHVHAYTPEKTLTYERLVQREFRRQCGSAHIGEGSAAVKIIAHFAVPNSAGKRKAQAMRDGAIRPTKKPDCDNIAKIVCDALNGIAYRDDAQIVCLTVVKRYASALPHVSVEIEEVHSEDLHDYEP